MSHRPAVGDQFAIGFGGSYGRGVIFEFVPQNEFIIDEQPLLDRSQRSLNPRIVRRKEADKRNQEQLASSRLTP